ncbi:MAG TPA: TerB family tellurite resistance protein [Xanthobacteraceae bacterium]|nr:TerB family tellurite resistance protein [Xanthobacteraceae bacterium]
MFRSLSDFISSITRGEEKKTFDESDYRLSAAALLVHVAASDDHFDDAERNVLLDVLTQRFDVAAEDADALIEAAAAADREAVDLYQFTSMVNRALDEESKKKLVEVLFLIGYADGKLSEFEDNIVWRAAELLHVSSQDRVEIRKRIRAAAGDRA